MEININWGMFFWNIAYPYEMCIDANIIDPEHDGLIYGYLMPFGYQGSEHIFFYLDRSADSPDVSYIKISRDKIIEQIIKNNKSLINGRNESANRNEAI